MNEEIERFKEDFTSIAVEISKVIVGYQDIIQNILIAFFANGHVLLEGVPGLGKTLLVKTFSQAMGFEFKRIQFTPDLMPADIIGTQLVLEKEGGGKEFKFAQGPIFANIILADEINRATPKTQSALLEAMEEKQVTIAGKTNRLKEPFFVMATQNPIEMEGTYPIPEAQLDRFFFKLKVLSPNHKELKTILARTTTNETCEIKRVFAPEIAEKRVNEMKMLVREVMVSSNIEDFIVRLIMKTHPNGRLQDSGGRNPTYPNDLASRFISYGSSPRGGQAIVLASKIMALLDGRPNISYEDIEKVFIPALNHRIVLNFEADADNVNSEYILKELMKEMQR